MKARELAQQVLDRAQPAKATAMVAGAHWLLGAIAYYLGELEEAREHLELAVALFAPGPFRDFGEAQYARLAPAILTTTLLWLGYPTAALRQKPRVSGRHAATRSTLLRLPTPCCGKLSIMCLF